MSKIHIALLGREPLPAFYPLVEEKPDKVFILCTAENKDIALRLQNAIKLLGNETFSCEALPYVVEAFNIKTVIDTCQNIHKSYPARNTFTYNITGGTKLMAIGAYSVAREYGATVIYTDSKKYVDLSTYDEKPLACRLGAMAIFTLQGQQVKSYTIYQNDQPTIDCAHQIMEYIKKYAKYHNRLMKNYVSWKGNTPSLWTEGDIECACSNGHVEVNLDGENILGIEHPKAKMLLFEGRWWEILTAQAIWKWASGKYEIWHDVKFQPQSIDPHHPNNDKNEVDLLFDIGNTIVFVECKSGNITQDNIYKMDFIRKTYGSDKSRSVLVSFYPVRKELLEKAKEAKIDVIYGSKTHPALNQITKKLNNILNSIKA